MDKAATEHNEWWTQHPSTPWTCEKLPESVYYVRITHDNGMAQVDIAKFLRERTAYRHVKSYCPEYGICTCSECHADVEQSDNFCARCGARFDHTEYERVGDMK